VFGDRETVKEEEGGMRFTFDLMDDLMPLLLIFGLDRLFGVAGNSTAPLLNTILADKRSPASNSATNEGVES
jgi:hypothetical protein